MPTIEERIEKLLDQLEARNLTPGEVATIERKIAYLKSLQE